MKKIIVLAVLVLIVSMNLFASGDTGMPWESPLNKVLNSLTGWVPLAVGIAGIVIAGIMIIVMGMQAAKKLVIVIIGLAIAINAPNLLTTLFGVSAGATTVLNSLPY